MPGWYVRPEAREWRDGSPTSGARSFHESLPGYAVTPLVSLPELAAELQVGGVQVKDESRRLGLPAFKILGASWAVARIVAERTGADTDLTSLRLAVRGSGPRLVTATDGNHGRAVAHMAALLGLPATVFVPSVTADAVVDAIAGEGAEVVRTRSDYDATVAAAARHVDEHPDAVLVQDTGWPGYHQVPGWIVEGYDTMLAEIDDELGRAPDLVVVPVGVGSLAQAVVSHYRRTPVGRTAVLSVEPDTAACLLASLAAGVPRTVTTGATVMAGLNCGTVSEAAWPVLHSGCDAAVAVPDAAALQAVSDLADLGVSSGPSGASSLAGARHALGDPGRRAALGIGADSTVVLLSTEARPDAQPPATASGAGSAAAGS